MSHSAEAPGGSRRSVLAVGVTGYIIWGLIPALFILAGRLGASPWEIVGQRALWAAPCRQSSHGLAKRVAVQTS